jgi:alkaline phosphatase D
MILLEESAMARSRALDHWLRQPMTRRSLLAGGAALCGLPYARLFAQAAGGPPPRWAASPFSLGVASGDPTATGVVLWTRLAPDPLNGGGMPRASMDVEWEVGSDEGMQRVVRRGTVPASPAWAHSVHVEVDGLQSDRWYWYRFRAGDAESQIGRTRTLPQAQAAADRLRFAFASCQHYETGLFTAYRHMAEEDLDLVFHLGDYIYEAAGVDNRPRKHVGGKLLMLEDYRNRYAQYRTDPDLQAAHARVPWCVTWDDHEVENNYADDASQGYLQRGQFLEQRAAAYQAYYEHMPLRRTSMPKGPSLQLYRGFTFGSLASFFILDTRQYRTDQSCGDGNKVPCEGASDPYATLLGRTQERWLFDGLAASRSRWHVLPQQVMMAPVDQMPGEETRLSMDQWPGYDVERQRIMEFLATTRPANPVVLTGDIHTNWVNDLKADYRNEGAPIVGTELVGTSIASGGDGGDPAARIAGVLAENPFVKYYSNRRGYVRCEVTPDEMRVDFQTVAYVSRPGAPKQTDASFVIEDGRPGAQRT